MHRLGVLAGCVPLLYPVLVHTAVVTGSAVLRVLALTVLIINVLGPWLIRGRIAAWLMATLLIAAAALTVPAAGARAFFYATPVLICLALAWLFARTLLPGRTPLITLVAGAIRGPLPSPVARYTRAVTIFWTATMLVMALVNLGLALFASTELWSLCTNFVNYLFMVLLFVAEWWLRQRVIGAYEHMGWREYMAALRRIDYRKLVHD